MSGKLSKTRPLFNRSLLVCDFFKSLHKKSKLSPNSNEYYRNLLKHRQPLNQLKVFLCGKELGESERARHSDKRYRIKAFLNTRMGCSAFLGEDIEAFRNPIAVDVDALTIEVEEAKSSDLIFIFLESFGTTAELAAFVTQEDTVKKLVVFNDKRYNDPTKPSFLSLGPLKLLNLRNSRSVIYYDPEELENGVPDEMIAHLDASISRIWHRKCIDSGRLTTAWSYDLFTVMASIYTLYPVTVTELQHHLLHRLTEVELNKAIWSLREKKWIILRQKGFLEPVKLLSTSGWSKELRSDISDSRTVILFDRLNDSTYLNNYRVSL